MANSANVIGQFTDEVEQATGEVVEDVKDSVGQAIEQGLQSVTGKQLTPQQIQQKQQEDQTQLIQARKKIKWIQDVALAQRKVQQEEKQKASLNKQQQEDQEHQKKLAQQANNKSIISPAKKAPPVPGQKAPAVEEEIARSKQEIGKGHGIGG